MGKCKILYVVTFITFELIGTKSYKYICLVLGGKDICLYISKPQYTNMQISSGGRGSCLMCGESCTKHPSLMCHMDWQYCYQTTPPPHTNLLESRSPHSCITCKTNKTLTA